MRKSRIILWAVAAVVLLVSSLLWMERAEAPVGYFVRLIAPDGSIQTLPVEVADDDIEQSRGLMFRDALPAGAGMLFVFDEPQPLSFWMKNTLIPLDILYFDAEGVFVSRTSMDPCIAEPCRTYPSIGLARYALEVQRGESGARAVGSGWIMQLLVHGEQK